MLSVGGDSTGLPSFTSPSGRARLQVTNFIIVRALHKDGKKEDHTCAPISVYATIILRIKDVVMIKPIEQVAGANG